MQASLFALKNSANKLCRSTHSLYQVRQKIVEFNHYLECICGHIITHESYAKHKAVCNKEVFVYSLGSNNKHIKYVCPKCMDFIPSSKECNCQQTRKHLTYLSRRQHNPEIQQFFQEQLRGDKQQMLTVLHYLSKYGDKTIPQLKYHKISSQESHLEIKQELIQLLGVPMSRFEFMRMFAASVQLGLSKHINRLQYLNKQILEQMVDYSSVEIRSFVPNWDHQQLLQAFNGFTREGYLIETQKLKGMINKNMNLHNKRTSFFTKHYLKNVLGLEPSAIERQFIKISDRVYIQEDFPRKLLSGLLPNIFLSAEQNKSQIKMFGQLKKDSIVGKMSGTRLKQIAQFISKVRLHFQRMCEGIIQNTAQKAKQYMDRLKKLKQKKKKDQTQIYQEEQSQIKPSGLYDVDDQLQFQVVKSESVGSALKDVELVIDINSKQFDQSLKQFKRKRRYPKLQEFGHLHKIFQACKNGRNIQSFNNDAHCEYLAACKQTNKMQLVEVANLIDQSHAKYFYDAQIQKSLIVELGSRCFNMFQLAEVFNKINRYMYVSFGNKLEEIYHIKSTTFESFCDRNNRIFIIPSNNKYRLNSSVLIRTQFYNQKYYHPNFVYKAWLKTGVQKSYSLKFQSDKQLAYHWALQNEQKTFPDIEWYIRALFSIGYKQIDIEQLNNLFKNQVQQLYLKYNFSHEKTKFIPDDFKSNLENVLVTIKQLSSDELDNQYYSKASFYMTHLSWFLFKIKAIQNSFYSQKDILFNYEIKIANKIKKQVFGNICDPRYDCVKIFNINQTSRPGHTYLDEWQIFFDQFKPQKIKQKYMSKFQIQYMTPSQFRSKRYLTFCRSLQLEEKAIEANKRVRQLYYKNAYSNLLVKYHASKEQMFQGFNWTTDDMKIDITVNRLYDQYFLYVDQANLINKIKPVILKDFKLEKGQVQQLQIGSYVHQFFRCCKCNKQLKLVGDFKYQCQNRRCILYQSLMPSLPIQGNINGVNLILKNVPQKIVFKNKFGKKKNEIESKIKQIYKDDKDFKLIDNHFQWNGSLANSTLQINIPTSKDPSIIKYFQKFDYIPVQIKFINEAIGYGVFCTQELQQNTIVTTYSGDLYFSDQFNYSTEDNDIVQVGVVNNRSVMIKPKNVINLGRFLNSSTTLDEKQANCSPYWRAFIYNKIPCIALFLVTNRDVKQGEQLRWYYNGNFMRVASEQIQEGQTLVDMRQKDYLNQKGFVIEIVTNQAALQFYGIDYTLNQASNLVIDQQIKKMNAKTQFEYIRKQKVADYILEKCRGKWQDVVYSDYKIPNYCDSMKPAVNNSKFRQLLKEKPMTNLQLKQLREFNKIKDQLQMKNGLKRIQKLKQIQKSVKTGISGPKYDDQMVKEIEQLSQPKKRSRDWCPEWFCQVTPNHQIMIRAEKLMKPEFGCMHYDLVQSLKELKEHVHQMISEEDEKKLTLLQIDKILAKDEKLKQIQAKIDRIGMK